MKAMEARIAGLAGLPCMARQGPEMLNVLRHEARVKQMERNAIVFEEADPAEYLYVVQAGSIRMYKASREGRELSTKTVKPGQCTCCAPLFGDGRYFMSARSIEDSTLIVLPAEKFRGALYRKLDDIGLTVIVCLSKRIEYLSALLGDLTFNYVEQRIMISLLRLAEEKAPDDIRATLTFTHSDIASMTGTVREVVSRTMSRLKREGIIIDSTVRGFKVDKGRLRTLIGRRAVFPDNSRDRIFPEQKEGR